MASLSPLFPSELLFGSFFVYPSPVRTPADRKAKDLVLGLKQNRVIKQGALVELLADGIVARLPDLPFRDFFDGRAVLVPIPTSKLQRPDSVWPSHSIAEAFVARHLAAAVVLCLERAKPIRKSAFCKGDERPSPREQYDSMRLSLALPDVSSVVLVDDVVTRGAHLSGAAARLLEAFPHIQVRGFAVARTKALEEHVVEPCVGKIITPPDGMTVSRWP